MSQNWSLKKAVEDLSRGYPSPLSSYKAKGGEWVRFQNHIPPKYHLNAGLDSSEIDNGLLALKNRGWGKSDAVKFTIREGWTTDIFIYSENNRFFFCYFSESFMYRNDVCKTTFRSYQ